MTDRRDEFSPDASSPPLEMERREFLRLAGATAALAGLAGCSRQPKALRPYVVPPDGWIPGAKTFYATAMPWEGFGRGILVETHEGRPTKIEGNPRHRDSGGSTDAITQASIRDLYDPDRSAAPVRQGTVASWADFSQDWLPRWERLRAAQGDGWGIVIEPTTSPTLRRLIGEWSKAFPKARWYQHTALARYDRAGTQEDYRFAAADVVLAIGSDFLLNHPAALRYTREFAQRRKIDQGRLNANRLYVIESAWTVTGGMADERLVLAPSRFEPVLRAISDGLNGRDDFASLGETERDFAAKVIADLRRVRGTGLCLAGPEQSASVRTWTELANRLLASEGRTVISGAAMRGDGDAGCAGGLAELTAALNAVQVRQVCILGANPVYTSPNGSEFREALAKAEYSVHFGQYLDETGEGCQWHLPESHYLEAWGDLRGYDGTLLMQQPLIEPLRQGKSAIEMMHWLTTGLAAEGYDIVRGGYSVDEETWREWLNAGVASGSGGLSRGGARGPHALFDIESGTAKHESGSIELVIRAEPYLRDGRYANNAWLQELPRPFTSLVWDNALWVSPEMAQREKLATGDVLRLTVKNRSVEAPVVVVNGTADGCAIAELGGGRRRADGSGKGGGFDAFALRGESETERWLGRAAWERTGRSMPLVQIQTEMETEDRHPIWQFAAADTEHLQPREDPAISLFPTPPPGSPAAASAPVHHRWAMLIDLSSCTGCSACVAACQAENNTPSVGKDQCGRGRHMHWIRVDRYWTDGGTRSAPQPVPCMQCEKAPCELVCPVGATVHSSEGLNEMVYNRCVGTRYCSNNCPYKVRRFNFFDFRAPRESPLHLQENPAVTVRARGVMEKCSYCVQRIDEARIASEREHRPLRDGELRTACQQACPAEAIVFGDLSDPNSAVLRRKRERTHYALLAELNTHPRTTYLARMVNPSV
ncbi:MAG TPA: hypothetical protein VGL42_04375 [Opitutaceae bacterium]|jgi:molybdopterin-containing oxidoreductase family iron-sulfur binding subunit